MVFENQEVEVFELDGKVLFNPYHVGRCLELTDSAVRMAIKGMNSKQVILMKNPDVNSIDIRKLNPRGENFLTESGVYKLIFKSRKKEAEKFCDWVTDEVLPAIRQTGKYETKATAPNSNNLDISSIQRKLYNGKPVLLRRDLEKVLGLTDNDINYIARSNKIGFAMLSGKELDKFKVENPNAGLNMLSNVRLYSKEDVIKVANILGVSCNNEELEQYFFEELSDYEKLWRVQVAGDIQQLTYRMGKNCEYRKMLFMVASKIYMDCGLLDGIYDDLEVFNVVGHNLSVRVHNFRNNIRRQLTK